MKKILVALLILILISQLYGCGIKKDISEFSTAVALGIDKNENGYKVSIQTVNPLALGKQPRDIAPALVISSEGKTFLEAIMKMSTQSSSKIFLFHIHLVIFNKEVAEEGIENYLNYLTINRFTQHSYNFMVIKNDTAENVLKIQTTLNLVPSVSIQGKIENSESIYGLGLVTNLDLVVNDIKTTGIGLVLSSIILEGDPEKGDDSENNTTTDPDAKIKVSTLAVFKKDKLVGFLNEEQTLGYKHIMGKLKESLVNVTLKDGTILTLRISKVKTKTSFILDNNKPKIIIDHNMIINVPEDIINTSTISEEILNDFEMRASYEVTKRIDESIQKAKELNSDIFKFIEVIHRKDPKYWATIVENYDDIFNNLDVLVNVKTIIKRAS